MSGGSLDTRLWDKEWHTVSMQERLGWACDTAEGMAYIHSLGSCRTSDYAICTGDSIVSVAGLLIGT